MAAGLPVVASPTGVNLDVVSDGDNGFLATSAEQWIEHLEELIGDPALRERLGTRGRESVSNDYSEAATADKMLNDLQNLC
jgi:glycosyltransferase involved in cell wall biosynthesis